MKNLSPQERKLIKAILSLTTIEDTEKLNGKDILVEDGIPVGIIKEDINERL